MPNNSNERFAIQIKGGVQSTALQLTLAVCYLPFYIVSSQLIFQSPLSSSLHLAWEFSATLVYVNSSINPILCSQGLNYVKSYNT